MSLPVCMIITLLGMNFIPVWATQPDPTPFIKMVIALVFIIIAWLAYFGALNVSL